MSLLPQKINHPHGSGVPGESCHLHESYRAWRRLMSLHSFSLSQRQLFVGIVAITGASLLCQGLDRVRHRCQLIGAVGRARIPARCLCFALHSQVRQERAVVSLLLSLLRPVLLVASLLLTQASDDCLHFTHVLLKVPLEQSPFLLRHFKCLARSRLFGVLLGFLLLEYLLHLHQQSDDVLRMESIGLRFTGGLQEAANHLSLIRRERRLRKSNCGVSNGLGQRGRLLGFLESLDGAVHFIHGCAQILILAVID
mmetsp:Transcript_33361/g.72914  ORF Transcript_33361/g.72914 Transcript_33361/m.72914 type:complete len:254 (+) Transcript_33361:1037-1798(+)